MKGRRLRIIERPVRDVMEDLTTPFETCVRRILYPVITPFLSWIAGCVIAMVTELGILDVIVMLEGGPLGTVELG